MRHAALLIALCAASCSAPSVQVVIRAIQADIDGSFAASTSGNAGSTDTEKLGLGDAETSFPRVDRDFGAPRITFDDIDFSFSGSGTLNDVINLGGVTFPADEPVNSDPDAGLYTGSFTWDFLPTDLVELGLGLGLMDADVSAKIVSQRNSALSAKTDEVGALPVAAARVAVDISRFRLEALVRGMQLAFEDVDTQYFDLGVLGRFSLGSAERLSGAIDLGWRVVSMDLEYEDDHSFVDGNFEFSGPYAGVTISF